MTTSDTPDRESQSRELAGFLNLCKGLTAALVKLEPNHELASQAARYALYLEGHKGDNGAEVQVFMRFGNDQRTDMIKSII